MELTTPRLRLRPFAPGDRAAIHAVYSDPEVMRFVATGPMADLVRFRDPSCVFPGCKKPSRRCDLDHIVAYLPPDEGGPPGQTHPDTLACLCRRHHRAKTARVWRYARTPQGHYLWHGPHNATYLVTDTGTHRM